MAEAVMAYYKLELLRHAWWRGLGAFVRQVLLLGMNLAGCYRVLVFVQPARRNYGPAASICVPGIDVKRYTQYECIPESQRSTIHANRKWFFWDTRKRLEQGGWLWTATIYSDLAALAWTFPGDRARSWFLELAKDDALIWWTVTLPHYRGRGIQKALYERMLDHLASSGARYVYVACSECNLSSERVIRGAGFRLLGIARRTRRRRQLRWKPVAGEDSMAADATRVPASCWPEL